MKTRNAILALLTLLLVAPVTAATDPAVTVNSQDNIYVNELFGLSVEKPGGWYAQNVEEMIMSQQRGNKILAGDDKNMQAMLEAAKDSSLPIFGFYEYPPGTPDKINPNILSVAENIKLYPGIKHPCDYVNAVKSLLQQGKLEYTFNGDCQTGSLAGRKTGYLEASLNLGNLAITQRYYAILANGYALSFIQTFTDKESLAKVDQVMNSITFTAE